MITSISPTHWSGYDAQISDPVAAMGCPHPMATPRAVVLYAARMGQQERLMEIMEQIAAGRTSKLVCPFCSGAELEKGAGDYGPIFTCPACRKFIEAPNLDE